MSTKTHNLWIYHCQSCGKLFHLRPEDEIPDCCGGKTAHAADETVVDEKAYGGMEDVTIASGESARASQQRPR